LVTAQGDEKVASEAIRRDVADYVKKADGFWEQLPGVLERVTKLAQAERQIRRHDALLQLIANHASDLVVTMDCHNVIKSISAACHRVLGYAPSEMVGRAATEFIPPEDRLSYLLLQSVRAKSEEGVRTELRIRHKEGYDIWLESNFFAVKHPKTLEVTEFIGIARDITKRKEAEDTRYRDLYDNAADMLATISPSSTGIIGCNKTLARITGQTKDQLVGSRVMDLFHDDCRLTAARAFADFETTGEVAEVELDLRAVGGGKIPISFHATPVRTESGEVLHSCCAFHDISVRKQADRDQTLLFELGESIRSHDDRDQLFLHMATRTAEYFSATRCHMVYIDLARDVALINSEYCRSGPSMIGSHPLAQWSKEGVSALRSGKSQIVSNAATDPLAATRFATAHKPLGLVALVCVPLFKDGQWAGMFVIANDTPRDWTPREVSLIQSIAEKTWLWYSHVDLVATLRIVNRRLERSNQELQQFAYVASHDLRAPLRAIDSLSQWLEQDLGAALQGETRDHMRLLRGRVKRMEHLLADLLEYARVGSHELLIENIDVSELVAEVIELSAIPSGFVVTMNCNVAGFATLKLPLKRVLMNLLSNAIKHHDQPNGRIDVTVRDIGKELEFVVTDDGPGIPPQFHAKAFQMFQTLRSRDKVEGSGMGLALVKKLVESAGGAILLDSSGRGAKFSVTWPKLNQKSSHLQVMTA
jgi:PAS domain S-box-containing protein